MSTHTQAESCTNSGPVLVLNDPPARLSPGKTPFQINIVDDIVDDVERRSMLHLGDNVTHADNQTNCTTSNSTNGTTCNNCTAPDGTSTNCTGHNGTASNSTNSTASDPAPAPAPAPAPNGTAANGTYQNGTYPNGTYPNGTAGNGTNGNGTYWNITEFRVELVMQGFGMDVVGRPVLNPG